MTLHVGNKKIYVVAFTSGTTTSDSLPGSSEGRKAAFLSVAVIGLESVLFELILHPASCGGRVVCECRKVPCTATRSWILYIYCLKYRSYGGDRGFSMGKNGSHSLIGQLAHCDSQKRRLRSEVGLRHPKRTSGEYHDGQGQLGTPRFPWITCYWSHCIRFQGPDLPTNSVHDKSYRKGTAIIVVRLCAQKPAVKALSHRWSKSLIKSSLPLYTRS